MWLPTSFSTAFCNNTICWPCDLDVDLVTLMLTLWPWCYLATLMFDLVTLMFDPVTLMFDFSCMSFQYVVHSVQCPCGLEVLIITRPFLIRLKTIYLHVVMWSEPWVALQRTCWDSFLLSFREEQHWYQLCLYTVNGRKGTARFHHHHHHLIPRIQWHTLT